MNPALLAHLTGDERRSLRLCEETLEPPWRMQMTACNHNHPSDETHCALKVDGALVTACIEDSVAEFACHARVALPAALTTIAELRAELAQLRGRLTTGIGLPLGVNDRDGKPVHVGDTLAFDGRVWSRRPDYPNHAYTVTFRCGEIRIDGTVGDISHYCRVVKRWDAETPTTSEAP